MVPQSPGKCQMVGVAPHNSRDRKPHSKRAGEASHISKIQVQLRDPASKNKWRAIREDWTSASVTCSHMCACARACAYTHTHRCTSTWTHGPTCEYTCKHTLMLTHMHRNTWTHKHIHTDIHAHTHEYTQEYMDTHSCTLERTHTQF